VIELRCVIDENAFVDIGGRVVQELVFFQSFVEVLETAIESRWFIDILPRPRKPVTVHEVTRDLKNCEK
jgi:hypothetical protein